LISIHRIPYPSGTCANSVANYWCKIHPAPSEIIPMLVSFMTATGPEDVLHHPKLSVWARFCLPLLPHSASVSWVRCCLFLLWSTWMFSAPLVGGYKAAIRVSFDGGLKPRAPYCVCQFMWDVADHRPHGHGASRQPRAFWYVSGYSTLPWQCGEGIGTKNLPGLLTVLDMPNSKYYSKSQWERVARSSTSVFYWCRVIKALWKSTILFAKGLALVGHFTTVRYSQKNHVDGQSMCFHIGNLCHSNPAILSLPLQCKSP
jgi:hypothetical protein